MLKEESENELMEFVENIRKGIALFLEIDENVSDDEALILFENSNIKKVHANEIIIFLPIAFVRCLLPDFNWDDEYIQITNGNEKVKKRFSETGSYKFILLETKSYFETKPCSENIIRIAGRSAEFQAINDLLLIGNKLEEIKLTKSYIWYS